MIKKIISEGQDFGYKGNRPGFYDEKGNWSPIDTKTFPASDLKQLKQEYIRRRGVQQIRQDLQRHEQEKKDQQRRRQQAQPPATTTPPPATTTPPPATTTPPPAAQPRPQRITVQPAPRAQAPAPKPLETRMSAVTGKREFVGTTPSGQKFERRAATSAELKAARGAREKSLAAAPKDIKGAELAAVKAGISASKTQKEEKMDAFDLVLEYLTSEGHVETLDEALYVMMEMDSETIQSICEAKKPKKWIQKAIKHPGALSKELGVPEEENIPAGKLKKAAKAKGKLGKQARLAMTLKGLSKKKTEKEW